MSARAVKIVGDLSKLPSSAMGPRSLVWWGTLGFMLIEGTGFLLAGASYLYLRGQATGWPPPGDPPPDLAIGTLFTLALLVSEAPNRWLAARAKAQDAQAVRWGMALMALLGVLLLMVRGLEFAHLNVRWDQDAYGSAVWLLMFLHATHLATDLGDTVVLDACLFTREISESQFADANDNCGYWTFVVLSWLPIYALVYWAPRLL
jgi:cytochrome c oxidase subunit III